MRIVINGVSIDCKNRSRIQIFDDLRHVSASMEVRTLAYILERDMKRRAARKPAEDITGGQALDHVRVDEPPMSARGDEFPPVEPVEPIPFVNLPAALCAPVPLSETVCPECDLRPGGSIKVKTLEAPVCMACGRVIVLNSQVTVPGHE